MTAHGNSESCTSRYKLRSVKSVSIPVAFLHFLELLRAFAGIGLSAFGHGENGLLMLQSVSQLQSVTVKPLHIQPSSPAVGSFIYVSGWSSTKQQRTAGSI